MNVTTNDLFSNKDEVRPLREALAQELMLTDKEVRSIDVSGLRAAFDRLPDAVREVAFKRGLSDALFGTNARLYFRRFPDLYRTLLGLPKNAPGGPASPSKSRVTKQPL